MPVYNEAATLRTVLDQVALAPLPSGMELEMIVVDNGSTDGSLEIARSFCRMSQTRGAPEVRLLTCAIRGKGSAVREGLTHVTGDVVLIQDADLEYDVNDYPLLLEPILAGHTDFVLGSRHLSAGTWKIREFAKSPINSFVFNLGGLFFHGLFNALYGVRLTDPTTMYKVFRRSCLEGLTFHARRFDFDYELLGKLIRKGYKPLEVGVNYCSRGFAEGKKIRIWADPWTWVLAIVRFRYSPL